MPTKIKDKIKKFVDEKFIEENLESVMGDRFGRYSKYIIQERAIPDVRDGLKPVQRRILYGMNKMGITSKSPFKKSARIVGEVMGKYHPHGDSSIYEAMVRMSQTWKNGVVLISMHGNNGSIDGDGPAAMRYTEARLSENAQYLLNDIDKETVPFIPNFDEEELEPTVLPAKFPNLLVNGAMGISSGYATYIPTHNINEIVSATIYLIDHPDMNIDDLLKIVPGPDFPTGGIVQGLSGIRDAFLTGSGSIIVQSRFVWEEMGKDQYRLVIEEVPYDTNKAKTVERIDQIRIDKKVEDILEVRDETDRTGLRIAVDLKPGANKTAVLNYLFKNTDLRVNIKYNMVSIYNQVPKQLGVIAILSAYLDHQKEVITNRTNYLLKKAEARRHIVLGFIYMVSILDDVIHTIRKSNNKADSKENLCSKFSFTDLQAEAIVTMQLYRLSNTDILALEQEEKDLGVSILEYNKILSSDKELLKVIKGELTELNKTIVIPRRTTIEEEVRDLKLDESDLISNEQVIVVVTRDGYVKRSSLRSFTQSSKCGLKENDAIIFQKEVSTLDTLLVFTSLGNYIYLPVYKLTESKFGDVGTFINLYVNISPKDRVVRAFDIPDFKAKQNVLLATERGNIKQVELNNFDVTRYSKAIKAMKVSKDDQLVSVDIAENPYEIVISTKNAELLRYRASDVNLYSTTASGVKAINLKVEDSVVSARYADRTSDIMLLTVRGNIKRLNLSDFKVSKRARSGLKAIKLTKTNTHYIADMAVMSTNQYKENVLVNVVTDKDNLYTNSFDYKLKGAIAGQSLVDLVGTPLKIFIDDSKDNDPRVSDDYLLEEETPLDIFDFDGSAQKPIKVTAKKDILLDLDSILKNEGLKDKKESSSDETIKKETKFKKVSLFDEDM